MRLVLDALAKTMPIVTANPRGPVLAARSQHLAEEPGFQR